MKKKLLLVMSILLGALIWTGVQFASPLPETTVQDSELLNSLETGDQLTSASGFDGLRCVGEEEKIDGSEFSKTFYVHVTNGCERNVDVRVCIKRKSRYGNRIYWESSLITELAPDRTRSGFVSNDLYQGRWVAYSQYSSNSSRVKDCPADDE